MTRGRTVVANELLKGAGFQHHNGPVHLIQEWGGAGDLLGQCEKT